MKTYNGGSITNLVTKLGSSPIYVTDTYEKATRYANAQATGIVDSSLGQALAEGAVVLEIESSSVRFLRRPENHSTLDTCEAVLKDFTITKAFVRFHDYQNTLYGHRPNFIHQQQVIEMLKNHSIEVEVIA